MTAISTVAALLLLVLILGAVLLVLAVIWGLGSILRRLTTTWRR